MFNICFPSLFQVLQRLLFVPVFIFFRTDRDLLPSGVSEISGALGGSTIGARMGPGAKLYREIARPLYRLALRAAARRHGQ